MEKRNSEQERGNNGRQGRVPYNRLAEDMAQPLADLQVPGVNNGSGTSENGLTENETDSLPGPREPRQGRHRGQRRTPYQQLAADMAVPVTELQVPGASNVGEKSSDGQVKSEMKDRRDLASVDQRETKRRERNHYFALAAEMSGPLAGVRAPAIGDERGSERPQPDHRAAESVPYQESLSEYNPDASCGSGYDSESCRHSSTLLDVRNEREAEACQGEDMESVAVQESFSEYNENACCGSGFYRSECSISDYQSSVQTSERESFNQRSFAADCGGFRSKSPSEIDTAQEKCNAQVDGEPFSKRTKPNTEVSEELSFPRSGLSFTESTIASDVQFESVPEVYSVESKLSESLPVQGEEKISTQNIEERAIEPRLTSEFEHMNLADNNSVETRASFDSFVARSVPVSHSDQEVYVHKGNPESLIKDEDRRAVGKSTDPSVVGNDFASCSTNADSANMSTSFLSQGARPKTRPNVPREKKKHKTPKQNTKNAYTELAKVVADDLSAMNSQNNDSHAETRRADDEKKRVRRQELFDGSTVGVATSSATSMHSAPFEAEQLDTLQQPSLMDKGETRGNDVQDQRGNFSREISGARAPSRRKRDAAAAAEHRSQIEKQQRLVDNMAPELQSIAIEMMQRDEEERGEHVVFDMPLNPPVPSRIKPRGRGGNVNQWACAEGALNQAGGGKSRKGPKGKGHYVELAGIIAPELAAVNATMVNGHTEGELAAAGHKKTVENKPGNAEAPRGITGSADEEALDPEPESGPVNRPGACKTNARSRDHWLSNGCAATSSRSQSRAHVSLPPASIGRETTDGYGAFSMVDSVRTLPQRLENGNRRGSGDYSGKGNRGKTGKQKKPKEEKKNKSNLLQMAESMAGPLQSLNTRLEEQQRQQQLLNGHGAGARPEECVTRDTNGVWTNESCSSRKEDGHK